MSTQEPASPEAVARHAGAEAAADVVLAQVRAGMPPRLIDASADHVLAGGDDLPTPVAAAFYRAWSDVAHTYATAARRFGLDPEAEAN